MLTLGLDPSLTGFGWALIDSSKAAGQGRLLAKGVFKTLSSTVFVERYMYLRGCVGSLLLDHPEVQNVAVESPPYGEQFSEGLYGLYLYVTEALYEHRMDVVYFDPSSVKAFARVDSTLRKGSMGKSDMIEAARVDSGHKVWNHNEADAYIVARSGSRFWERLSNYLTDDELTPAEARAFLHIHTFSRGAKAGKVVKRGLVYREGDRFFRFSQLGPPKPSR